ncbi:MAG: pimeloyl-ACP methyl ester carboxylesterase [Flammeovirgaceae bacterium]|jgi:pimeloyl-ACP methyl ester carboxylesterase
MTTKLAKMETPQEKKIDLHLFSGLGADRRLYQYLKFPDYCNVNYIDWLSPIKKNETLYNYCQRLAWSIDSGRPHSIMGISFGGIIAKEMAKITNPEKIILISSIKQPSEFPPYFKAMKPIGLHNLFAPKFLKGFAKFAKRAFGVKNDEGSKLFADMVDKTPDDFFPWAITQMLEWTNAEIPENLVHLHGTNDIIFPHKYIKDFIPIEKGSHAMTMEFPDQITTILTKEIEGTLTSLNGNG